MHSTRPLWQLEERVRNPLKPVSNTILAIMRPGGLILTATILRSSIKASRRQNIVHKRGAASRWLSPPPHLEQQAFPRAPISDCTNRFFFVNTLGEFELDSACF